MTKNRNQEAYRIFRRIAQSNNKPCDELNELNALRRMASNGSSGREDLNSVSPMRINAEENGTGESGEEKVRLVSLIVRIFQLNLKIKKVFDKIIAKYT